MTARTRRAPGLPGRLLAALAAGACAIGMSACEIAERPSDQRPAVQTTPVPDPGASTLPASPAPPS
ncbi:hypothetical protein ACFQ23_11245 [Schaalia naturae]|jgi:hypothetical protein|uniref:Uncharacterized protein n=1 Tax=Schaalia naturae TaxID=635203 RepID=A0ABW2SM20_9ACTO